MSRLYSRLAGRFRQAPRPVRQFGVFIWRLAVRGSLARAVHAASSAKQVCKLHIGAGPNALPGWFNADLNPSAVPLYFMDAAQPFPFRDGVLDYIFSEHMIEHINFENGERMLAECFRTLRPGGKIRIATPDLEKLISVYSDGDVETEKYIQLSLEFSKLPAFVRPECFVVNHFVRAWGHQFIYDAATLRGSLLRAGFTNIRNFAVGESDDPHLVGIERHQDSIGRLGNDFVTMVFQAGKPLPARTAVGQS